MPSRQAFLVREVKPTDFDDIAETWFSFFPEVEADPSFGLTLSSERPSLEEERKWFTAALKEVQDGDLAMVVAEVDAHVVGWCRVRRVVPKSPLDHRGSLGVCVRKGLRGQGIGRALVKAAIEKCKGKFESLELTVIKSNRGALKLYKELGFKTYGVRPAALKRGGRYFDDELMYLTL